MFVAKNATNLRRGYGIASLMISVQKYPFGPFSHAFRKKRVGHLLVPVRAKTTGIIQPEKVQKSAGPKRKGDLNCAHPEMIKVFHDRSEARGVKQRFYERNPGIKSMYDTLTTYSGSREDS
eukprot:scaffold456_cov171-Amphora_coffeaeformis.AAC.2